MAERFICKYPDCDGGNATGYCRDDCSTPDHRPEVVKTCRACDGEGLIAKDIWIYEHGCGFGHSDSYDVRCDECDGLGFFISEAGSDDYDPHLAALR